ncbi:MAG: hypothetical protein K6T83_10725 [Alicyclobacillus sp.]|nr:hypothetical protein [Alicyclobacillus sp.]
MGQRQLRTGLTTTVLSAVLAGGIVTGLAGCGMSAKPAPKSPHQTTSNDINANDASPSDNHTTPTDSGNSAATKSGSNGTNTANGAGGQGPSTNEGPVLQSATIGQVSVDVPQGWDRSSIGTGDWVGWRYQNPEDPNEQIIVAFSSCIGCYTDANGNPNPKQVIPEANATNIELQSSGTRVTYQIPAGKNPYTGSGLLAVTTDLSGYGYVEVYAPATDAALTTRVLNSFRLSNAG